MNKLTLKLLILSMINYGAWATEPTSRPIRQSCQSEIPSLAWESNDNNIILKKSVSISESQSQTFGLIYSGKTMPRLFEIRREGDIELWFEIKLGMRFLETQSAPSFKVSYTKREILLVSVDNSQSNARGEISNAYHWFDLDEHLEFSKDHSNSGKVEDGLVSIQGFGGLQGIHQISKLNSALWIMRETHYNSTSKEGWDVDIRPGRVMLLLEKSGIFSNSMFLLVFDHDSTELPVKRIGE